MINEHHLYTQTCHVLFQKRLRRVNEDKEEEKKVREEHIQSLHEKLDLWQQEEKEKVEQQKKVQLLCV